MGSLLLLCLTTFCLLQTAVGQCDTGYSSYNGHCYRVSANQAEDYISWADAAAICHSEGANLASIGSQEEHNFILTLAQSRAMTVGIWTGLTRKSNPAGPFTWTDGHPLNYTYWSAGHPKTDGTSNCAMSATSSSGGDFESWYLYTATYYIMYYPGNADGINTFFFGSGYQFDEAWCRERCRANSLCAAYTWVDYHWDYEWQYTCTGRSNYYPNIDYDGYSYTGLRRSPDLTYGWWFSVNCGVRQGFACKKPEGSDAPVTPAPTVPLESYCPADFISVGNKCYKVVSVNNTKLGYTWGEALTICRAQAGNSPDLASIHSQEDNAAIAAVLTGTTYGVWIGGMRDSYFAEFLWSDNTDWNFATWMPGEPSAPTTEFCIQMMQSRYDNGLWNDLGCTEKRGYVCQTYKDADSPINTPPSTTPNDCEAGWTSYNGACYQLDSTARTWQDANDNCKSLGAELVSVHASSQNSAVFLFGGKLLPVWIGFKLNASSSLYEWSDTWPVTYTNWDVDGMAGGTGCVTIKGNELWQNWNCTEPRASVCWKTGIPAPTTPAYDARSCPAGFQGYGSNCYYFDAGTYVYSFDEAYARCQEVAPFTGVNIVSISSHVENQYVLNEMKLRGITGAWLGLRRDTSGTGWYWTDGTPFDFVNWGPDEPNNGDGSSPEYCTHIYADTWPGLWNDVPCEMYGWSSICKIPKGVATTPATVTPLPGNCPSGEWIKYGGDCLLFRPTQYMSWNAARTYCQGANPGADLPIMYDAGKSYYVAQKIIELSTPSGTQPDVWIGLSKPMLGQPYVWVDGTPLSYTNWAAGEPNDFDGTHNCGKMLYSSGTWDDYDCYDSFYQGVVCETAVVPEGNFIEDEKTFVEQFPMNQPMDFIKPGMDNAWEPKAYQSEDSSGGKSMSLGAIAAIAVVASVMLSASIGVAVFVHKKRTLRTSQHAQSSSVTFDNPLATEEGGPFERSTYQY